MSQFASMESRNKFVLYSVMQQLDSLILSTPTGVVREALTSANIYLMQAEKLRNETVPQSR
jgi:hypothetical protein